MIAACLLLVFSCSDGFPPEFPAADFSLKSPLTGSQVGLADIKGKPVIIYWFTSW
jgi:peroxiredoxin